MKRFFYLCFFLVLTATLSAQTAGRLERMLENRAINYGDAALFVLEAAGVADRQGPAVISSPDAAFRFAAQQGWLPRNVSSADQAKLRGVSLLVMKAFDIRGGIFYSIFQNPRYAYRELAARGMFVGRVDPDMAVSGENFLFLLGRVLSHVEAGAI